MQQVAVLGGQAASAKRQTIDGRDELIISLTQGRFSAAAIAAQLGMSKRRVHDVRTKAGVTLGSCHFTACRIGALFGVSHATVLRWIRIGALPASKPRSHYRWLEKTPQMRVPWLVTEDELLAFVETSPYAALSIDPAKITDSAWRECFEEGAYTTRHDWLNTDTIAARYAVTAAAVKLWRIEGTLPRGLRVRAGAFNHISDLDGFAPPYTRWRQVTVEEMRQVRALHASGMSNRRVAAALGLNEWQVRRVIIAMKANQRKAG